MQVDKTLGLMFPVCDGPRGDEKHFPRFLKEIDRLGLPFAVYFDHCTRETYKLFSSHRLYFDGFDDVDQYSSFDEGSRRYPLNILIKAGFGHILQMDLDETLERDGPAKLRDVLKNGADVTGFWCLDIWDRPESSLSETEEPGFWRRIDGPFGAGKREKVFKVTGNTLRWPAATAHAPDVWPTGKTKEESVVKMADISVIHWGIRNLADAQFHRERWDRIYTRAVGGNPYQGYEYYFDKATVPAYAKLDDALIPEHCLDEVKR